MKRVIKSAMQDVFKSVSDAKYALNEYPRENVEYVKECRNEILKAISDSYNNVQDADQPIGSTLSEIKRDYMLGAVESGMMDEDEFEDILDLLDILSLQYSQAYASSKVFKKYVKSDYNIDLNSVDDDREYTWKIRNYIQDMPNGPMIWRLYKSKSSDPRHFIYKVTDVTTKRIDDLAAGLKKMPLLKQKGANINVEQYADNEWVATIDWYQDPEED